MGGADRNLVLRAGNDSEIASSSSEIAQNGLGQVRLWRSARNGIELPSDSPEVKLEGSFLRLPLDCPSRPLAVPGEDGPRGFNGSQMTPQAFELAQNGLAKRRTGSSRCWGGGLIGRTLIVDRGAHPFSVPSFSVVVFKTWRRSQKIAQKRR
jgi:hypothetical protein